MSGALRAELRRISTTKLWWITLICIFVLSAGYAALPASVALLQSRAGVASSPFADPGIIRSVYNGGNVLSRILAMVVGIVAIGSEYRYGTVASELLGHSTPRPHVARQSRSAVDLWRDLRNHERGRGDSGGGSFCARQATVRCCSINLKSGARSF